MSLLFVSSGGESSIEDPWFTFDYEGGRLEIYRYDRIEVNGKVVYTAEAFDPWFEQDRIFIEAVRSGDSGGLLNDYHDGLYTLGPVLAGWDSARDDGRCVVVSDYYGRG